MGLLGAVAMSWLLWAQIVDWDIASMTGLIGESLPSSDADAKLASAGNPVSAHKASSTDCADGTSTQSHVALKPAVGATSITDTPEPTRLTPIGRALASIEECQTRYRDVRDYTCTFSKRERINGRMTPLHVLTMKVRTDPQSIYLKFRQPTAGREAIYIAGRYNGKVLAHDVGLNRLLAGTLHLDPNGGRAMEECRHPISEAGIGPLLKTLETRWASELDPSESVVVIRDRQSIGDRRCTMIETTHPQQQPDFLFYRVRLYIDDEIGLPIHFEAYDWPNSPEATAEMVEEYTYSDVKLNVGLTELDFDVSNRDYAFGRF